MTPSASSWHRPNLAGGLSVSSLTNAKNRLLLIGIPYRVTVGKKLAQGKVEVLNRRKRESVDVPTADAPAHVASATRQAAGAR